MLYNDRKMLKWQGFMLSEHAEQMQETVIEKNPILLDEQAKDIFDRVLAASVHYGKPIEIKMMTFGEPYFTVTGVVKSVHWEEGYIQIAGSSAYFYMKDIAFIDFADGGWGED
ncbi:hypothetical protein BTO30_10825 [Domibacillus antri]|uniref:YolD-like family protein n=1 Tax=Domibacillus antri TaxID=1714264 RepID=A0A1Q8Q4F1_9BACI|nr:YolD-like family protein [Domibacillus antri]OLN22233.1 hypothetical protein BTO30_10825 [Domibacillus antri]